MERTSIRDNTAFLYCREETKREIRQLKRGGETFDERIRKLAQRFDPDSEKAGTSRGVDEDDN